MLRPLRTLRLALGLTALLITSAPAQAEGPLRITILDVGQGDSTLIQAPGGRSLLFDGGKNGRGDAVILPFLQAAGIDTLDYMVASHYHADHVGGLDEVYENIVVREAVYDRGYDYGTLTYGDYAAAVAPQRQTIAPGQVLDLGEGVTVTCVALNGNGQLAPPFDDGSYENEYCVSLLVEYGGFDFFVAGDLTGGMDSGYADIETSVAPLVGDVDIYRVNHHGSFSSSNPFFLQTLQAEVSLISVGSNSYGHPHQPVLDRLVQYGSFVYQTEPGDGGTLPPQDLTVVDGHIDVVTDGVATYTVNGDLYAIDEESLSDVRPTPVAFRMLGNHPNPFNPATVIRFMSGQAAPARLGVYDVMGRLVYTEEFQALEGPNALTWHGVDRRGASLPGGVYLYRVESAAGGGSGRMVLLK